MTITLNYIFEELEFGLNVWWFLQKLQLKTHKSNYDLKLYEIRCCGYLIIL